jgi:phosphodiesterase/alkaline phosphatase D-like protein
MSDIKDYGPRLIVGHVTDRNASIWGRGDATHPVMFVTATSAKGDRHEEALALSPRDGYTGVADLETLAASTTYKLEVSYGAKAETPPEQRALTRQGQVKTFPAPDQSEPFTFLLNSCNFHGFGPFRNNDGAAERRAQIAQGVDLAIHAGDQVYADKSPLSFTLQDYRGAYLGTWGDPGTQRLLASQPNYMVADDHEVVNGFAEDGKLTRFQRFLLWARGHGDDKQEQYAEMSGNGIQAFDEFQGAHAPNSFGAEARYYTFSHGQHQFFAMDTRFERNNEQGQIISDQQRDALFGWLKENRDQPKFILTSTPFIFESVKPDEKWCSPEFSDRRNEIIEFLAKEKLDNVAFLTGDIHASGHAVMEVEAPDGSKIELHELCASPVNGSKQRGRDEFVGTSSGTTSNGTRYRMTLQEESFLGKREGWLGGISNSAVMKVHVDGENIRFETYRTRADDAGPIRQGHFRI